MLTRFPPYSWLARVALVLLTLVSACAASAATPLRLSDAPRHSLSGHMEVFLDPQAHLTLQEVLAQPFAPLDKELSIGFTASAVWLKFTVERQAGDPVEWWLEPSSALYDRVDLFIPKPEGGFQERDGGAESPWASRELDFRNPVFKLQLEKIGTHTLYVRLQSQTSMASRFTLWQPAAFTGAALHEERFFGFLFGIYVLIIVFYLAFWRWTREPLHGMYAAYVSVNVVASGAAIGWAQQAFSQVLPPELPFGPFGYLSGYAITVGVYVLVRFNSEFLDLKRKIPRLGKYYVAAGVVMSVVCTLLLLCGQYRLGMQLAQPALVVFLAMGLVYTVVRTIQNDAAARIALWAFTPYYLGIVVRFLRNGGVLDSGLITDNAYYLGTVVHILVMGLGIFARYNDLKTEKEAAQKLAAIEHGLRLEQRGFIELVSHELRTPLAIIQAALDNLLTTKALDTKLRAGLEKIDRATARLTKLMSEQLSADRLDSADQPLRMESCDVAALARSVVAEAMATKGPVVQLDVPQTLITLCDHELLRVALRNILANARRHSALDQPVRLSLETAAGQVRIVVSDHGEGIPPEDLPHIFERYFRGKNALTSPGAGLGLNLVERIMKRHHGTASAQSTVGVGTQIVLSLPLRGIAP